MTIALCTDNSYAMPAGVMMYSVCLNSGPASFFVVIPSDFLEENKRKLRQITGCFGSEITFVTIRREDLHGFPIYRDDQPAHISIAAYYRLFLTDLLPDTIDKVLYLDCDLLCLSALTELWNINIDNKPLACISDIPYTGVSEAVRLGYDEKLGYFNSGVLLINLRYWREHNVRHDFIRLITDNNDIIRYHDQDILNCVFKGQVLFIHPRFNAQDRLFHLDTPCFPYPDNEVAEARNFPAIIHFTYKNKPWILGGRHPYQHYFTEYKAMTPWKNTKLRPKKADNLKGHLINVLVILGLYKYHDDYITIQATEQ